MQKSAGHLVRHSYETIKFLSIPYGARQLGQYHNLLSRDKSAIFLANSALLETPAFL